MPRWAGGLGIPCLRWLNIAMQSRWAWLRRVDSGRPWTEFKFNLPKKSLALVAAATKVTIGNGKEALFWEDRWLHGIRIQEFAPGIYERISKRARSTRTVHDAISMGAWTRDISPDMAYEDLVDYLEIW